MTLDDLRTEYLKPRGIASVEPGSFEQFLADRIIFLEAKNRKLEIRNKNLKTKNKNLQRSLDSSEHEAHQYSETYWDRIAELNGPGDMGR